MTLVTLIYALLSMNEGHHPKLNSDVVREHVEAAQTASDATGVPVELLLGMATVESGFDPDWLSYRLCEEGECIRKVVLWRSDNRPPSSQPSFYCGAVQVGGWVGWDRCVELRNDLDLNYMEGATHLVSWMNDPYCRNKKGEAQLVCALQGYNGGYASIKGSKMTYATRVLSNSKRIRKLAEEAKP